MTDDELRARLQRADPARSTPPGPDLDALLEATMSSTLTPRQAPAPSPTRRRTTLLTAAAIAAAALGVATWTQLGGDDPEPAAAPTVLEVEAPGEEAAMAMCLPFDLATLAGYAPAYDATAVAVEDGRARMEVNRTYAGAPVDELVVRSPGATSVALIGGIGEFEVGQRYLLSVEDGTITACGYSGPWSADYAAQWEEAYGG